MINFQLPIFNSKGYNPYRSPDGRFAPGPNSKYVQERIGFSLTQKTTSEEINTFFKQFRGQPTHIVAKTIYGKLGFNELPTNFTEKDYKEGIAVTRAFNPSKGESRATLSKYRQQLFEGERHFSSDKISPFGTGDYFEIGNYNKYKDPNLSVMAYAKIKGSTRIVDHTDVMKRIKEVEKKGELSSESITFLHDYGIFASLSGYEAIINKTPNEIILLDRRKLSRERF